MHFIIFLIPLIDILFFDRYNCHQWVQEVHFIFIRIDHVTRNYNRM
jgi:hypothetical protein